MQRVLDCKGQQVLLAMLSSSQDEAVLNGTVVLGTYASERTLNASALSEWV